jgi:hypothetical protein
MTLSPAGKQVIRQLKNGEFDGGVMTSQNAKSFLNSLRNVEGTGLSLESGKKEIAECYGCCPEGCRH